MPPATRCLPALLFLLMGSGGAALMYEVVWYQMLQLAIGSTTVSMAFLLAAFMGGLSIGSLGFAHFKSSLHPLKLYAYIEIGIAILGLLVLLGLPLLDRLYFAAPNMITRGFLAGVCLLPPAILMGASLPAAARWIESTGRGPSWWGLLYSGSTLGAVIGCLFTGFYVLREFGQTAGTLIPAAINLVVAVCALALAARTPAKVAAAEPVEPAPPPADGFNTTSIYITIALSGAGALGAEVVWTRLLTTLMGPTTYVFSIILAVFLVGIGLGSTAGAWAARTVRPRVALGACQMLLALAVLWACYNIAASLPYWPVNSFLTRNPWFIFQMDLARALWTILPPALLWGASFPLALAAISRTKADPARLVGGVYAANTLGAIIGALSVSLFLIPWIGTLQTQRLILILSAAGGVTAFAPYVRASKAIGSALIGALILSIAGGSWIPPVPAEFIAYGRQMPSMLGQSEILETAEGINSSVAISRWPGGTVYININGHVEATTEVYDMALQRTVGHLPALLHPNPKSVLAVGFGAGISAGAFTRYPGIEKITICEIEPVIPPLSAKYFAAQNYDVLSNKKTNIVFDDARHFMLTTTDKFDVIASDLVDVYAKGRAALYSKEYFETVKSHLNPGGFFTLYVPLYESDVATVQSELATFFSAFPQATIWANTRNGEGYDMVLLGQVEELKINLEDVQARLDRPEYAPVAESLREVGFESAAGIFRTYAGRQSDLSRWFGNAEITHDNNLRLMYLAGWSVNSVEADPIYREMLRYREIPKGLFQGSPEAVQQLFARPPR